MGAKLVDLDNAYDVVIIGARVAGATLAALLGDSGYRVLLVDRMTFPSPTLSTHYFRGGRGVSVLHRLGVLEEVLTTHCPPLVCQYVYKDGAREPLVQPAQQPGTIEYGLSVRRGPLDDILVRRAAGVPSVDLLDGTAAIGLLQDGERVTGVRLATRDGDRTVQARLVVGADGRRSFVARGVNAPLEETEAGHRGVYYRYARDFPGPGGQPPDGPEFSRWADEQAYVFPSDDGLACLAISLNLADYAWVREQPNDRFYARLARHPGLTERLAQATWSDRLLGCGPETNYVRVPVGPGWALVGDAGMHQDPWTGLGIDKATVHAAFLAEVLVQWFRGDMSEGDALADYHARRNADGLASYRRTVETSRDLRMLDLVPPTTVAAQH